MMANHGMHYNIGSFHPYLWRYYTQTEAHRAMHLAHDPSAYDRLVVTGYPKLDVYLEDDPTERLDHPVWGEGQGDTRIIFAPHHSLGQDNLNMGTFRWTHERMLEFARSHERLRWVYKPHATLRHSVVKNGIMTREQYAVYERAWADLPNATIYDSGDYFDIFRSSDVLITDSGSFLAEYLPTGNPIIWLVHPTTIGLNEVGQGLARGFYDVHDLDELDATFQQVVVDGNDPMAAERAAAAATLLPTGGSAARAVVGHLRSVLVDDDDDRHGQGTVGGAARPVTTAVDPDI
jgi:CDP-glycerol glycerophosphotransferase (TagB/SpsB family)